MSTSSTSDNIGEIDKENTVTVYVDGYTPPLNTFSGSIGRHVAELDAPILKSKAHNKLRAGLVQLATSLLRQYSKHQTRDSNSRVVGIKIHAVEFTFIFDSVTPDGSTDQ